MGRSRAWLVAALLAGAGGAGCGFDRRSSEFACAGPSDCIGGRTCVEGWCVLGGGGSDGPTVDARFDAPPGVDGPPGPDAPVTDAFACPSVCSRCDLSTCVIACDLPGSCATVQTCPAGYDCRVECNERNSCAGGVDCTAATSCRVQCVGTDSCLGAITCGPGRCRAECTGTNSCMGGIDCSTACACDTFCAGTNACTALPPTCPGPPQCDEGLDCSSMSGLCDSC